MSASMAEPIRCAWAGSDPLMVAYHDAEWGVPMHDDSALFELLTLEGAQAGLSWSTILRRRDAYREAFASFDIERVAAFGNADVERVLTSTGVIRNRQKVVSTVTNARAVRAAQQELGSFDRLLWSFVPGGEALVNHWDEVGQVPALTPESQAMSRALRKRGFAFVGPTICYALMQSAGLVNDHTVSCFRFGALSG